MGDCKGNGWDQHKIDVLNRLDRIEETLKEIQVDGKAVNRTLSKINTKIEVINAKAGMVAATITIVLTAGYHLIIPLFK